MEIDIILLLCWLDAVSER